jgi:hypothetical protein
LYKNIKLWYHVSMAKQRKAKTIRLTQQDEEAIAALKAYYGITSENEVIRLALQVALREIKRQENPGSPAPQTAERRLYPHVCGQEKSPVGTVFSASAVEEGVVGHGLVTVSRLPRRTR